MYKPSIYRSIVVIVVTILLLSACAGNRGTNSTNPQPNEPSNTASENNLPGNSIATDTSVPQPTSLPELIIGSATPSENNLTPNSTATEMSVPQATPLPEFGIGSTIAREADGMQMVYVPAGSFIMGMAADKAFAACQNNPTPCPKDWFLNAEPDHSVSLDAYWIDQTEVTNAMFAGFVAATGYQTDGEKTGKGWAHSGSKFVEMSGVTWKTPHGAGSSIDGLDDHPVVGVDQTDAIAYCQWAGTRLPTEAEWEKAARGTDGRFYPWGNQPPDATLVNFADVNAQLHWADKNVDDGFEFTAPVGSFPAGASPYGALDMAGNVWEWVSDWFSATYYAESPASNPQGPASGGALVNRGGGWTDHAASLFSIFRASATEAYFVNDFSGFRCASSTP